MLSICIISYDKRSNVVHLNGISSMNTYHRGKDTPVWSFTNGKSRRYETKLYLLIDVLRPYNK